MHQPRAVTIRRLFVLAVVVVCVVVPFLLPSRSNSSDEGYLVSGLKQVGRVFSRARARSTELGKNHELVKQAFRDVIADANESTVRVIVDGKQVALGTIISRGGLVLTKLSELEGKIRIAIDGDQRYPARIEHRMRELDLAMLRIDGAPPLRPVKLDSRPQQLTVGSWVAVPGGRTNLPLAVGVVSSPVRAIQGRSARLGVYVQPVVGSANFPSGAMIQSVITGSCADRCGIKPGDIVQQVDRQEITGNNPLQNVIGTYKAGDDIRLAIHRPSDQKTFTIKATLGAAVLEENDEAGHTGGRLSERRSGFDLAIQHDCPLRANQCGGPLVDVRGRVIGINIAKAGRVETYALPISIVHQALGSLAERREPQVRPTVVRSRLSIASVLGQAS